MMFSREVSQPKPSLHNPYHSSQPDSKLSPHPSPNLTSVDILNLQQRVGNQAVNRMLAGTIQRNPNSSSNAPQSTIQRDYQHNTAGIFEISDADFTALSDAVDGYAELAVYADFGKNQALSEKQLADLIKINDKLRAVHVVFDALATTYAPGKQEKWKANWKYVTGEAQVTNTRKRSGNFYQILVEETVMGEACHNELGAVLQACLRGFEKV